MVCQVDSQRQHLWSIPQIVCSHEAAEHKGQVGHEVGLVRILL
jgi:hypothetical protein